ncbi:MAG: hypothetical protein K6E97_05515 [Treponema sp.]|nr:hypothetical protein [Treponema sp.]
MSDKIKKRRRRLGDRPEGRRLRTLEPINVIIPFIMKTRNDASNLFSDAIELSAIKKYVHEKRHQGKAGYNAMHVLVASYIRSVAKNPGINRFINGYRIFARKNIQVIMEVKKELSLNAPATMLKFNFTPEATADEVYENMNSKIMEYKNAEEKKSSFEKVTGILCSFPRWIFKMAIGLLKLLDYYGKIPKFLINISPFHGSLVITSMASLNIPSIYHHLYNFGNVPMFISFSTARHENAVDKNGELLKKHFLDIKITTDERICDGQYFASALHELRRCLNNPHLLDNPPDEVVEDID